MKLNFIFLYIVFAIQSFGAVNSLYLQIEGNTSTKRTTINRLLTNGTSIVGDSDNMPQVVDIATQSELNSLSSVYQGLDSDLTSIAGLVTTSFGRGILTESSASTLRSTLGLVIGTNVQGYDLDLDDLADGSLTGTKVGFADTDNNFLATNIQGAIEELDDVNISGPNASDGKVEWSQLVGVPAGFADGADSDSAVIQSGTQFNPTTTNPFSPTWTTNNDYIVYYGATGTINLPAVATYSGKTLFIYSTGTFTITVDPNGSEIIVKSGVALGAGTADIVNGVAGLLVGYICDGVRWIKLESSGSSSSSWADIVGKPDTIAGFGITDAQPLDTDLTAIAALATPAADRIAFYDFSAGTWAYLTVGANLSITGTTLEATTGSGGDLAWTDLSGGTALTIGNNYYDTFTTGRTLTLSGTPAQGNTVRLNAIVSSGPITLNIPSSYRVGNESTETTILLQNGTHLMTWQYVNSKWVLTDSSVDAEASYTLYGNFGGTSSAPTFSTSGVLDFGGWTSFELPNSATPTVDTFGEIAADNNIWASGRGSLLHYDGTAATALIGVLVSDTPSNGQVPVWNTGGTITWEDQSGIGGSGDVTAASNFVTDNRLIRSDGTGKGVQSSGISIDDSNNMTGISSFSVTTAEVGTFTFEGSTLDDFETSLVVVDPTADRTITLPNATGTVALITDLDTSEELRGLITDKTGTGAAVFAGGNVEAATATTPAAGDDDTSVATTAYVQDEVDGTKTGSHASPSTTNPLSPTWSGPFHAVWYGATGTINLPAAANYAERGIMIYNTGSFTITIDPNASEEIVRDGNVQTGGVSFTLSSGAGNFVSIISDGTRWITLGYKGTLNVGS